MFNDQRVTCFQPRVNQAAGETKHDWTEKWCQRWQQPLHGSAFHWKETAPASAEASNWAGRMWFPDWVERISAETATLCYFQMHQTQSVQRTTFRDVKSGEVDSLKTLTISTARNAKLLCFAEQKTTCLETLLYILPAADVGKILVTNHIRIRSYTDINTMLLARLLSIDHCLSSSTYHPSTLRPCRRDLPCRDLVPLCTSVGTTAL